jgi:hypothetical protein
VGVLADFDLADLMHRYGCRYLIETGTGLGKSIDHASQFPFEQIFSIEIMHSLALQAGLRFAKNPAITIIHGKSERGLVEALEEIPGDAPVIYWLDAHFPGADFRLASYRDEKNEMVRLPLERELRLLSGLRDISRDVFLIDDLRIYEDGAFEEGPCPADHRPAPEYRHVRFVQEILGGTHQLEKSLRRTGYLCAFPKTSL